MRRRLTVGALAGIAVLAATGAALSLGGGATHRAGPGPATTSPAAVRLPAHAVEGRRGALAGRAVALQRRQRIALVYKETARIDLPAGPSTFSFSGKPCSRRSAAINGYYFYDGSEITSAVHNDGSSPRGFRNWTFFVSNENVDPANEKVRFGIICEKGVR